MKTADKWYKKIPEIVSEEENATTFWNFLRTKRTIKTNPPDIVVNDQNNKFCLLTDMTMTCDYNVSAKEFDKLR